MATLTLEKLIPEHIRGFEAYYPSKPDHVLMALYGVDTLHRLNNNENPMGPCPAVRKLTGEFPPESVPIYPNGDCFDLRELLAARFGKSPDQFLAGNGSCEVISAVIKAFCTHGDNIITADKTFAVYEWVAEFSGLEARLIPLKNYAFDPQAMLDAIDDRTKILFVCNPNNPTGAYWDKDTMEAFLKAVDGRCMVVVDEAYFEYVDRPDYPNGMELLERYPNVVVFRTFSKMYALAALRIGYLCGSSDVVGIVRRAHIVYSVNTFAQQAAAASLLDDAELILSTRRMVREAKELLCPFFDSLGLEYLSGEGNFVMVRTPVSDTLLYRMLMKRGIMIRTMTGFRFPNWIRITLAKQPVMKAFASAFSEITAGMAAARGIP